MFNDRSHLKSLALCVLVHARSFQAPTDARAPATMRMDPNRAVDVHSLAQEGVQPRLPAAALWPEADSGQWSRGCEGLLHTAAAAPVAGWNRIGTFPSQAQHAGAGSVL